MKLEASLDAGRRGGLRASCFVILGCSSCYASVVAYHCYMNYSNF